jgi:glycosyltransferase involved in cell wall biosynthesis
MALGKPTVAYIRDDLVEKLEKECPILVTNPDQLKHDLSEWVKNSSKLKEVGKASRRFAKKYHCSKVVAKKALKIYETL